LIDTLFSLPAEVGERPVLVITNEMSLLTLSERRAEIVDRFRVSLPTHDTLLTLQDKVRFHEFATAMGLPVPTGVILRDQGDVSKLLALRFPVVIKPADKRDVHLHRVPRLVVLRDYEQASRVCRVLLKRAEFVAQQWVDGSDDKIYFSLIYRGDNDITLFSGQKLASSPPGTGSTAMCIHAGDARGDLKRATHQFLETVPDFRGFGSVEFKWDSETQRWVIIEPTVGRTDWQEEIATLLGVNIPYAGYLCECGMPARAAIGGRPRIENIVWQASYIDRWKAGSSTIPHNAVVVDGFWRRDDPLPAMVHYPPKLVYSLPSLAIAISRRMRNRATRVPPSWGWQLRKGK
jgi:predicted ATP-grasp superfamily ATP-dependent carboligase